MPALEHIQGIPNRIADLKRKLKARSGKAEYKENCTHIKAEIARLESVSASRGALEEFIAEETGAVASDPVESSTL
jgi:hypothetical protein